MFEFTQNYKTLQRAVKMAFKAFQTETIPCRFNLCATHKAFKNRRNLVDI
jgi:hypothetical protein